MGQWGEFFGGEEVRGREVADHVGFLAVPAFECEDAGVREVDGDVLEDFGEGGRLDGERVGDARDVEGVVVVVVCCAMIACDAAE